MMKRGEKYIDRDIYSGWNNARLEFENVSDLFDTVSALQYEEGSSIDVAAGSDMIRESLDVIAGMLEREREVKRELLISYEKLRYGK